MALSLTATFPPLAVTLSRDSNFSPSGSTWPERESWSPWRIACRADLCGLSVVAVKLTRPGLSAVIRQTITLPGRVAKLSRFEGRIADPIAHGGRGGFEVERPAIAGGARRFGKGQPQIAERLVRLLPDRDAHELLHADRFRLLLPGARRLPLLPGCLRLAFLLQAAGFEFELAALVEQLTQLREKLHRPFMLILVRLARPERALVELQVLVGEPAEHHRPQPPIAQGQRLHPARRRLVIPELQAPVRQRAVGNGESQAGEHRPGQNGEEIRSHTRSQV